MIKIPEGFVLRTEEDYEVDLLINLTIPTYQEAFLKGVWQETLSEDIIRQRLVKNFSSDFYGYWLIDSTGLLACTSWYEFTDVDFLKREKGEELAEFVSKMIEDHNVKVLIWYTETITHPQYWHRGFAKLLKVANLEDIYYFSQAKGATLVLARMRDDNKNIIAINEGLGFIRTGIRMPCPTDPSDPGKYHEFWYKLIK